MASPTGAGERRAGGSASVSASKAASKAASPAKSVASGGGEWLRRGEDGAAATTRELERLAEALGSKLDVSGVSSESATSPVLRAPAASAGAVAASSASTSVEDRYVAMFRLVLSREEWDEVQRLRS